MTLCYHVLLVHSLREQCSFLDCWRVIFKERADSLHPHFVETYKHSPKMTNRTEPMLFKLPLDEIKVFNFSTGATLAVLVTLLVLKFGAVGSRGKKFPPGPKTTPVLGNALDFPTSFPQVK